MAFPRKPRRRDKNEFNEEWRTQRLVNTANFLRALVPKQESECALNALNEKRDIERKKWETVKHYVDSATKFKDEGPVDEIFFLDRVDSLILIFHV